MDSFLIFNSEFSVIVKDQTHLLTTKNLAESVNHEDPANSLTERT